MIKKIIFTVLMLLALFIVGAVIFIFVSYDKNYDEAYPVTDLKIEADSAQIERGRYLVQGPSHCGHCHAPLDIFMEIQGHDEITLSGGFGLQIPPGAFYAPNITPDMNTGIGRHTDGQLYRMMRYNIQPNGRVGVGFMPFMNMSDEDIYSVIAYLRAQDAVDNQMPKSEFSFLGKMLAAFGVFKPSVPDMPVLKNTSPDTTAEYGKYLAYAVANCNGCHTERDLNSGEFVGEPYAGGTIFGPDDLTKGWVFVSPNLTQEPETGVISNWSINDFIKRIRRGRLHKTSPMPWEAFEKMNENDLKAIYHYLNSLPPVNKVISNVAIKPTDE